MPLSLERYTMDFDLDDPMEMELAKLWTLALLTSIRQAGSWVVPRSRSIYIVDHRRQVLIKVTGDPEPAITRVAQAIGWTVKELP